jgi:hypothetical protein
MDISKLKSEAGRIMRDDLSPEELTVLSICGTTTSGFFGKKPKEGKKLTRFYLGYRFKSEASESALTDEMIGKEISTGIEGLIEKGLAVEDKKGVTLTPEGYALIAR